MKKILFIPLLALLAAGCDEENNLVQLNPPKEQLILDSTYSAGTTPAAQPKNVLIEDFTAVRCDNCPNAQHRSEVISDANPGRISVIGVHCTDLAIPIAGGTKYPDFRTPHGDDLISSLGTYPGLPIGDVDRKLYGNTTHLATYANWSTYVNQELAITPIANIDVKSKTYNPATHVLSMKIGATFTQSSTEPYYMSVAIIENGMIGPQITTTGINDTFRFAHVLRRFIEPYTGLKIADAPQKGMTYEVKFDATLDNSWVADSCRVVSFVHKHVNSFDVEQVNETSVK